MSRVSISKRESLAGVLGNMKTAGFSPVTVIDIGAALGDWSLECSRIFPDAEYVLVEPLEEYNNVLDKAVKNIRQARYYNFAASDKSGKTTFYVHRDLVGSSIKKEIEEYNQKNAKERAVETKKLDDFLTKENFKTPYLIKMDIQGAEFEALKGASDALKKSQAVILEIGFFDVFERGHQFYEVIDFMKRKGFVIYDVFGLSYRPYDGALSQTDVIFVPEDSELRKFHGYATAEQRRQLDDKFQKKFLEHLKS